MKSITVEEVGRHNSPNDAWIIVDGHVYDVTSFAAEHPGGQKVLLREAGKDATAKFNMFHKPEILQEYGDALKIGQLVSESTKIEGKGAAESSDVRLYGDLVPYGDPYWYQGQNSLYYTESHRNWRKKVRAFVEEHISPYVHEWDENYEIPREVLLKTAKEGILAAVVGKWPTEYVGAGPEGFDLFHEQITLDELARCGSGGILWGLVEGLSIGLPPVLLFGSQYLKDKVAKDCLEGRKIICLAISEPQAASDVAGLVTTARREGDYYIVNGAKKWITNGIFSDYMTVAVRTGGPKHGGLSFLLIESKSPGVVCTRMKCQGVWASGTTFVRFDDVRVPVSHLIGEENSGFKYIMYNFNHERWALVVQCLRFSRVCLEESFKYAMKRETFGKRLIDHQVIRFKIAEMARQVESTQAWVEQITYQMNSMSHDESNPKLGGPIAMLKAHTTKVFEYCAREAVHVFGGAGYVRGGVGEKVERLYREVRAYSVPGGAEEILLDFAARQAMKQAKNAKL